MRNFKALDLFTCAEIFTEGSRKAGGYETVLAVDFDKQAIDTFGHNHQHGQAVCADIASIEAWGRWQKI